MSMTATLLQVSTELFLQIQKNPNLLGDIFFEGHQFSDPSLNMEEDYFAVDWYHVLTPYFEQIAIQAGHDPESFDDCPEVMSDVIYQATSGMDHKNKIDFQFTYGDTFFHSPEQVKMLAQRLEEQLNVLSQEEEQNFSDITLLKDFFIKAAAKNKYVIGGIN
jgi:hypothetical protein